MSDNWREREAILEKNKIEERSEDDKANAYLLLIISYDMLFAVNMVSKYLQCKDIDITIVIDHLKYLISFFKNYREYGFKSSMIFVKEIAE